MRQPPSPGCASLPTGPWRPRAPSLSLPHPVSPVTSLKCKLAMVTTLLSPHLPWVSMLFRVKVLQGRPPHPSLSTSYSACPPPAPPAQAATPQAPRAPSCWVSAGLCSSSPSLEVTESPPALRWVSAQMSPSHRATLLSGFILSHSTYWLLTSGTYSHFSSVSLARTQAPGSLLTSGPTRCWVPSGPTGNSG